MAELVATFRKGSRVATLEWRDGLVAEVPVRQHPRHHKMPHDLEHYVVDAGFNNVTGFWSLLAQQAVFQSVRPLNGSWGRDRIVRSKELFEHLADQMNESEAMAAPIRILAHGEYSWKAAEEIIAKAMSYLAVPRITTFRRETVERVVESFRDMERRWQALDDGDTLQVTWPPADA